MPVSRSLGMLLVVASLAMVLSVQAQTLFDQVEDRFVDNKGVKIHYVVTGQAQGPMVLLVHGFPDFWYTWRHQMSALSDRFRVVAVDMRGYNQSDKPKGVENYAMPLLVSDLAAVIAAEKREHAIVVGHDWGGAVSWNLAMHRPDLVELLVILNLPHPNGLAREMRNNPEQQKNSQYAFNFQEPNAHQALTAEGLAAWVADDSARGRYVEAFRQSDFDGMLNYYRANYPRPPAAQPEGVTAPTPSAPQVKMPVLMFHGLNDQALLPGALNDTWKWLEADLTLMTIPGAGHFVQQDAAEQVSATLRDWLLRRAKF